jgi:hypothetical protein
MPFTPWFQYEDLTFMPESRAGSASQMFKTIILTMQKKFTDVENKWFLPEATCFRRTISLSMPINPSYVDKK